MSSKNKCEVCRVIQGTNKSSVNISSFYSQYPLHPSLSNFPRAQVLHHVPSSPSDLCKPVSKAVAALASSTLTCCILWKFLQPISIPSRTLDLCPFAHPTPFLLDTPLSVVDVPWDTCPHHYLVEPGMKMSCNIPMGKTMKHLKAI